MLPALAVAGRLTPNLGIFRTCCGSAPSAMVSSSINPHPGTKEITAMDKNRVEGSAKQAKGAVKEAVGKVTGDAKLQADGKVDSVAGKVQNAVGGANDAIREAAKKP